MCEWGSTSSVLNCSSQPCKLLVGVQGWTFLQPPTLGTSAALCVLVSHPRGPRRWWLHWYHALAEDHCGKEAVSGGRWAPEETQGKTALAAKHNLIFWGTAAERQRPLISLEKPPVLLKAMRKRGVSEEWPELPRQLLTFTHNKNTESCFCKLNSYSLLITFKL